MVVVVVCVCVGGGGETSRGSGVQWGDVMVLSGIGTG